MTAQHRLQQNGDDAHRGHGHHDVRGSLGGAGQPEPG
jgi:hypothetical protein